MLYRWVRAFLRLCIHVFFRRIEVVGLEHVPSDGAVLFIGNHPNSLLDPALITAFTPRRLSFIAKDTLFKHPILGSLLYRMGAIPIRRKQDHPDGTLDNQSAFTEVHRTLALGGAIGIFPEGISHNGTQLADLKTGAARIAIGVRDQGSSIAIVPCGLHYIHRRRFRTSVLIQFGPPLLLNPHQDEDDFSKCYIDSLLSPRHMTKVMELHLRALTVNADDWDALVLLDTVRRLYQPAKIPFEHRVELARRFNQYYPDVQDQPEVIELAQEIHQYRDDLYTLGVHDREISQSLSTGFFFSKFFKLLILGVIWLPLAVIGLWLHLPFVFVVSQSAPWLSPRKDVLATTKFLAGFVTLLGLYLGSGGLVYIWGGSFQIALLTPILLALSGFATLKCAQRGRALWRLFWVWSRCWSAQESLKELRQRRKRLKTQIKRVVDRYIPLHLDRLFYQNQSPDSTEETL